MTSTWQTRRLLKGDFDGFDQAMAIVGPQHEAIEHDLEAGLAVFRQCDVIVEVRGSRRRSAVW